MAVQPDGKFLVAGETYNATTDKHAMAVVRYNPNGAPDPAFGPDHNGIVGGPNHSLLIGGYWATANDVAVQPDGKLLLAGLANYNLSPRDWGQLGLLCYDSDGRLDPSFDGDGIALTDLPTGDHWDFGQQRMGLAVQPDGKIVIVVSSFNSSFVGSLVLLRYQPGGSLDPGFGMDLDHDGVLDGIVQANVSDPDYLGSAGAAVAVQSGGRILAIGTSGRQVADQTFRWFTILGYRPDGTLDSGFAVPDYVRNSPTPAILDPGIDLRDAELDRGDNYAGASLTLARQGGANGALRRPRNPLPGRRRRYRGRNRGGQL